MGGHARLYPPSNTITIPFLQRSDLRVHAKSSTLDPSRFLSINNLPKPYLQILKLLRNTLFPTQTTPRSRPIQNSTPRRSRKNLHETTIDRRNPIPKQRPHPQCDKWQRHSERHEVR